MTIKNKIFKISNLLIFTLAIIFYSCNTKTKKTESTTVLKTESTTVLKFEKNLHDFGKLNWNHGVKKNIIFKFRNIGKKPLIIKNVKPSCGCTVPEWPKGRIKPNETSEIKISFNAKSLGYFAKNITIFYNGKDSPVELTIKGEVIYPDTEEDLTSSNKVK
jgi:hypothetical protein